MSIVDLSLLQQRRHSRKRRVNTEPHYHCATRSRADYSVQLPGSWVSWTLANCIVFALQLPHFYVAQSRWTC